MMLKGKTSYEFEQERKEQLAESIRAERDRILAECDKTQLEDAPFDKQAWAKYRKALRDITKQAGFPESVAWPVPPGELD